MSKHGIIISSKHGIIISSKHSSTRRKNSIKREAHRAIKSGSALQSQGSGVAAHTKRTKRKTVARKRSKHNNSTLASVLDGSGDTCTCLTQRASRTHGIFLLQPSLSSRVHYCFYLLLPLLLLLVLQPRTRDGNTEQVLRTGERVEHDWRRGDTLKWRADGGQERCVGIEEERERMRTHWRRSRLRPSRGSKCCRCDCSGGNNSRRRSHHQFACYRDGAMEEG